MPAYLLILLVVAASLLLPDKSVDLLVDRFTTIEGVVCRLGPLVKSDGGSLPEVDDQSTQEGGPMESSDALPLCPSAGGSRLPPPPFWGDGLKLRVHDDGV